MIGDPPNIMIGSAMSPSAIEGNKDPDIAALASDGVTFNDFIIEMAPGILLTIVPSFMLIRWLYKDEFSGRRDRDITELERQYAIKDMKGLKISGTILCLVIIGFFLHPVVHIAVSWVALAGAVVMLLATNPHELEEPLEHVEWTTLLFFAASSSSFIRCNTRVSSTTLRLCSKGYRSIQRRISSCGRSLSFFGFLPSHLPSSITFHTLQQ